MLGVEVAVAQTRVILGMQFSCRATAAAVSKMLHGLAAGHVEVVGSLIRRRSLDLLISCDLLVVHRSGIVGDLEVSGRFEYCWINKPFCHGKLIALLGIDPTVLLHQ